MNTSNSRDREIPPRGNRPGDSSRLRWISSIAAAALFLAALAVLLAPLPQLGRVSDALGDLLHVPLFALLAVLIRQRLPQFGVRNTPSTDIAVWLVISAFGLASEWLQQFVGREASFGDAAADVLGSAAGLAWVSSLASESVPRRYRARLLAALLVAAACMLPVRELYDVARQRAQMPIVASFEDVLEVSRWSARDCKLVRDREHATSGDWSLRLELRDAARPGAILRWPPRNWSRYHSLVFDAACDGNDPLEVVVKIEDMARHGRRDDSLKSTVFLSPEMSRFTVPLNDDAGCSSGRRIDLRRVEQLQFYARRPGRQRTLYLDSVRLE